MAEQLEPVQGQKVEAQANTEATTPAANGGDASSAAQSDEAAKPQVQEPEWKAEIRRLQESHQKEIQKLQHGMDKSFGKLRSRITGVRQIVDTLVPEPKREQFKNEDEFKQAQAIVQPIRERIQASENEIESAERQEAERQEREGYISSIGNQLGTMPQEEQARILGKYQAAIAQGQDFDLDNDMLSFVAVSRNGVQILDALYDQPQLVAQIRRASPMVKAAMLTNLGMSLNANQVAAQAPKPVVAQPVNPPAIPAKTGGTGGIKSPIQAKTAQEYLQLRLGKK